MKEVTVYKTTDGMIFNDAKKAKRYQAELNYREKVSSIVEQYYYRGMSRAEIIDFIVLNRDKLK